MRKLKTSSKTFLSVATVSLCILSFIICTQAATSIIVSYHLHKGTTVNGDVTSVWYQDDGKTLDIRLRRRGWINYFYEIDADFLVTVAKYDYIKWDFDHNIGSAMIKISVYYRDGTHEEVARDSPGEHEHSIDGNKDLDYIKVSYNKWTTTKTNYYVYIDYITAY